MKILHIAAHLGGGAGKAISGIAIQGQRLFGDVHRILLLQQPEKTGYVQDCRKSCVEVAVWNEDQTLLWWADVIVVSWWNHPVMAQFLRYFPKVQIPMLLWCHINGCHYPILPAVFANEFDKILFTSPYSLENPFWSQAERQKIQEKSEIVWGMGQFDPNEIVPKSDYQNRGVFTVGYVGTLNYGKIHPDFTAYCKEVCGRVKDVKFVLAGDRDAALEQDIRSAGLADQVVFTGFVSDVPTLMRTFDAFGYLLNPEHYGTTENVLLEAMACGLPCAVLRRNTERHIVPPSAGYLVESPEEYGERMAFLWRHPDERRIMGRSAREAVINRYHAEENTARFRGACVPKGKMRVHDFSFLGDTPWAWFLFCWDDETQEHLRDALETLRAGGAEARRAAIQILRQAPPILWEERKSSLRHFGSTYPEDESLQYFRQLINSGR